MDEIADENFLTHLESYPIYVKSREFMMHSNRKFDEKETRIESDYLNIGFKTNNLSQCSITSKIVDYKTMNNSRIIPLTDPHRPSRLMNIIDPSHHNTMIGFVLDLPRAQTTPTLDENPNQSKVPFIMPANHTDAPIMYTGGGWPLIRRRKRLNKHWLKKYYKRDVVIIKKRNMKRKAAREKVFREKMTAMILEAENFDAKSYVEDFLAKIQWDETKPLPAASLIINPSIAEPLAKQQEENVNENRRREIVHWTSTISIEQLYGLPESSRIDKKAGIVDEEEWQEIVKARERYQKEIGSLRGRNDVDGGDSNSGT
uniref:Uncharacterized protein n=1 Tax=Romanomermis culicivorax TaxID=13658 RepID=A0A915IJZ0_ROMCU